MHQLEAERLQLDGILESIVEIIGILMENREPTWKWTEMEKRGQQMNYYKAWLPAERQPFFILGSVWQRCLW